MSFGVSQIRARTEPEVWLKPNFSASPFNLGSIMRPWLSTSIGGLQSIHFSRWTNPFRSWIFADSKVGKLTRSQFRPLILSTPLFFRASPHFRCFVLVSPLATEFNVIWQRLVREKSLMVGSNKAREHHHNNSHSPISPSHVSHSRFVERVPLLFLFRPFPVFKCSLEPGYFRQCRKKLLRRCGPIFCIQFYFGS